MPRELKVIDDVLWPILHEDRERCSADGVDNPTCFYDLPTGADLRDGTFKEAYAKLSLQEVSPAFALRSESKGPVISQNKNVGFGSKFTIVATETVGSNPLGRSLEFMRAANIILHKIETQFIVGNVVVLRECRVTQILKCRHTHAGFRKAYNCDDRKKENSE